MKKAQPKLCFLFIRNLFQDLGNDAGTDRSAAFTDSEAETFLNSDGLDEGNVDFNVVAVTLTYPLKGILLPLRISFGGVNAENVGPGLDQRRNSLFVVSGIYPCSHYVSLMGVEKLVRVGLVVVVVLPEDKMCKSLIIVYYRKGV